jgi:hypothetical protein
MINEVKCKTIGCKNTFYATAKDDCDFCLACSTKGVPAVEPTRNGELDPHGRDPHQPGAKVDAGKVRMHLITGGMARAIREVAKVGTFGAAKYTDGGWVEVPDGFRRYEDAQQRHATYRHIGEDIDPDSGLLHLAHEAWNALAKLDLYLRASEQQERQAK